MKTNRPRRKGNNGMSLVEVVVSIAILGVTALLAASALFYPRYLVVNSALEQSAIHTGSTEIERRLYNYTATNQVPPGKIYMDGWNLVAVTNISTTTSIITDNIPATPDVCQYLEIRTTVTYRDGRTVELLTYRSLEVLSSSR